MDETFRPNNFALPLVTVIIEYWEARNHLLAWPVLADKTNDLFKCFLSAVRETLTREIRAVVTD
jgi:hypothetical protein